jgi:putative hydrolase of the HAD superfamily
MIVFDYGNTLLYEPDFSTLRGEEALFRYVKSNKHNLSPEEADRQSQKLFQELSNVRTHGFEIHEYQFQRLLYDYLEIELAISFPEAERIYWDAASAGERMPQAEKMLEYINSRGIRSGVISNIGFSGKALSERIGRLLPDNKFEFIIASSEYGFRKPSRYLFEVALRKAELDASEVWFCGDNIKADVEGAAEVGIYPVWYENLTVENPWAENNGAAPKFKHLHIHEWDELIKVLGEL